MKQAGWKHSLARISEWIVRIAWINLLWIAFTLLGLIVAGFLPSTAAMFAVIRKWLRGNLTGSVFGNFWFFYKREFRKANAAGFILLVAGYVLYVDLFVYEFDSAPFPQYLQLFVYIVAFIYLVTAALFFPVFVQYELKWFQYVKHAVLTAFSFPLRALSMLVLGYFILFVISRYPGAVFFFSGSLTAYLWLLITLPLFEKEAEEQKNSFLYKKRV